MQPRAPRQTVDRAAKVYFGGTDSLSGRIRNVSIGGAKLCIWGPSWIPYGFDLIDVFSGVRRKARVVWRNSDGIGVRFVDEGDWPRSRRKVQFGRRQAEPQR